MRVLSAKAKVVKETLVTTNSSVPMVRGGGIEENTRQKQTNNR